MKKYTTAAALTLLSFFMFPAAKSNPSATYTVATGDTVPKWDSSKVAPPDDKIFEEVEIEATFPGDMKGWRAFLEANLNATVPAKRKAPVGEYTVVVQFIVDATGKLSGLKAITAHGFGMEAEVLRVMRKSPRWIPAVQHGRNVKAYRKQPITFVISQD